MKRQEFVLDTTQTNLLANKVVIITGGAGLLGSAFAHAVVKHGGMVVVADCDEAAGRDLVETINTQTGSKRVDFVLLDITNKASVGSALEVTDRKYGKIDALVNNAYPRNKQYGRTLMDVDYADFCENLNLHLGGYFLMTQQAVSYFLKQGYGNIVSLASIYGIVAPEFEIYDATDMTMPVEYAAIKSGIIQLTKYFAKALRNKNIRVNALSPGGIDDAQPEAFVQAYRSKCLNKGVLDQDDIVGALVYLLSDMSRFVNGQNLVVDDGFTL